MLLPANLARFLAHYSEGLRLSVEHGPSSGMVVEYACRNQPHGSGVLGRWVDRRYLRSRAWAGVRQRIETTKEVVGEILARRRAAGQTTMVLDVASGTGRYLRELAQEQGGPDLVIACHDRNPRQVVLGRELVEAEGLPRFKFSVGDATDDSSYLTSTDPNVILAVGLFSILPCDADVKTVMRLTFSHLSPGGSFICTTLTKPRLVSAPGDADAFTARPATRSPELIATWLQEAGFLHLDQRFSQPNGFALIGQKPESSASLGEAG